MPMDSSESAVRLCTSSIPVVEAKPYSERDDEDDDDDDDELNDYWDLDELGVDPEEFYDLCRNCTSRRLS